MQESFVEASASLIERGILESLRYYIIGAFYRRRVEHAIWYMKITLHALMSIVFEAFFHRAKSTSDTVTLVSGYLREIRYYLYIGASLFVSFPSLATARRWVYTEKIIDETCGYATSRVKDRGCRRASAYS